MEETNKMDRIIKIVTLVLTIIMVIVFVWYVLYNLKRSKVEDARRDKIYESEEKVLAMRTANLEEWKKYFDADKEPEMTVEVNPENTPK